MAKTVKDTADLKSAFSKLEDTLDLYLVKKAPFSLPESVKEVIVKYGPWITLVILVAPFAFLGGVRAGVNFGVGMLFSAAVLVIEALAIPGLFKRKMSAWRLMFYGSLLSAVEALISFNLGGLVIGTGLSLYVLFQIKSYYK